MKTHISLNVSNVKASINFYEKMLGTSPFKVKPGYAKFDVANPPLNLTMNETTFEKGGSLSHLGLQVESSEEVLAIGKRWAENGLITLDEMQTECCFALQDKTWVADPDGNSWEVFTVLENIENLENAAAGCCTPSAAPVNIQPVS
jgi:catechol 2,3-dioxygenase-like lactoylglutathione lyase family enzyme